MCVNPIGGAIPYCVMGIWGAISICLPGDPRQRLIVLSLCGVVAGLVLLWFVVVFFGTMLNAAVFAPLYRLFQSGVRTTTHGNHAA